MKEGITQEEVEQMLGRRPVPEGEAGPPNFAILYFTAKWCGACKKLDLPRIMESITFPEKVAWYKCDVDENTYTPGFCGVKSMPSFMILRDKKAIGPFGSSNTEKVIQWIQEHRST